MLEKVFSLVQVIVGAALGSALAAWMTHDVQIRELELKQAGQIDKYVDLVTNAEKPALRHDIAVFFSEVTISEQMRQGWKRYLALVDLELAERKRQAQEKEQTIKQVTDEATKSSGAPSAETLVQLSELRKEKEDLSASLTTEKNPVTPRVYIHIRDENQRAKAAVLAKALYGANYLVPGVELVPVGPSRSELRYFRQKEQEIANDVTRRINEADSSANVAVVYVAGHEASKGIRENHFELWLAKGAGTADR